MRTKKNYGTAGKVDTKNNLQQGKCARKKIYSRVNANEKNYGTAG